MIVIPHIIYILFYGNTSFRTDYEIGLSRKQSTDCSSTAPSSTFYPILNTLFSRPSVLIKDNEQRLVGYREVLDQMALTVVIKLQPLSTQPYRRGLVWLDYV